MSQRCTATTKKNTPCRAWAVHDSDPPRCAPHGGGHRRIGAPNANQNALKHGAYAALTPGTQLNQIIQHLHRRLTQLGTYIDNQTEPLPFDMYAHLVNLEGQLASRLGRLMRDHKQITQDTADELTQAIGAALDDISQEWGIEL